MLAQRLGAATDVRRFCASPLRQGGAALAAAHCVERGIDRDAVQPSEEVGAAVERRQAAKSAHERLLRRIISVAVVAEDMESGGVHASLMAPDQAAEGFSVTVASPIEIGVLVTHRRAL